VSLLITEGLGESGSGSGAGPAALPLQVAVVSESVSVSSVVNKSRVLVNVGADDTRLVSVNVCLTTIVLTVVVDDSIALEIRNG